MNKNEILSTFTIDASNKLDEEKIKEFFKNKSVNIRDLKVEDKKNNRNIILANFESNTQSISILELIQKNNLYDQLDLNIVNIKGSDEYYNIYCKLMEEIKNSPFINYPIKYEDNIRVCFMKTYDTEGLEFIDHETIEKQRNVLSYIIKKIGTNILSGKSIMNVSLPIKIFDPRSMMEAFAYNYRISNNFLKNFSEISNLERLKLITSYGLATMSLGIGCGKPFNPILGETFQAKIGESLIYAEQTSHHPPIFNYYVKNPNFISYGYSSMEAIASPNSAKAKNSGKFYMKVNDGSEYQFVVPDFQMTGLMMGIRYVNFIGSMIVEDLTNQLISVININPEEPKSFIGKLFSSKPKKFPDFFTGFIAKKSDVKITKKNQYVPVSKEVVFANYEGEWSYNLNIDGVEYWKQGEIEVAPMEKMNFTLPSDSSLREDIVLLRAGYEDYAQVAKMNLENIQRNDKKLRESLKN